MPRHPQPHPRAATPLVLAALLVLTSTCKPAEGPAPAATPPPRVLFVGLDGADWELLDGYIANGTMPNLARLSREGSSGVLLTEHPPLSPLVWTTMMTGVSPLRHRILDFTRFAPATGVKEPITSDERRAPALWNIASEAGRSVAVFGIWATYPAEPVRGLLVADRFASFTWQTRPPAGVVHPPEREAWALSTLDRVSKETSLEAVRAYLPWLDAATYQAEIDKPEPFARPVSALRRLLIETRAVHALAQEWIARERPNLALVYFQGTDTVGHLFAPFAPPRLPTTSAQDFERFSRVPELYFAEVDRMLGEYASLATAQGATLMLASDHGFRWKDGRPARLGSALAGTAAKWHREEGIFLLWGGTIAPSAGRARGGVSQTAATILALLGLPPGMDMALPPLAGAPKALPAVDHSASLRRASPDVAATADAHTGKPLPTESASEEIAKLRALGYLGANEAATRRAGTTGTRTAGSYNNEGLILRQMGKLAEASEAFSAAIAIEPESPSAYWNLSELLFSRATDDRQRDRADALLIDAFAKGLPDGVEAVAARVAAQRKAGNPARARKLLDGSIAARPKDARLRLARGRARLADQDCQGALNDFIKASYLDPMDPLTFASEGLACLCLGDREGAKSALLRSFALDPNQPQVREALNALGN